MIIKALKAFSDGVLSLHEGAIANVPDAIAEIYISVGYAVEYTGEVDLSDYAKKADLDPLSSYIEQAVENGGNIYKTVPTDAQLLGMEDDTHFYAQGYYEETDGNGGYYKVTTTKTIHAREITDGTKTVYLLPLDKNGRSDNTINLCRYGVKEYRAGVTDITDTMTPENTFAKLNSNIIDSIVRATYSTGTTWTLPKGRFYFEKTIDLGAKSTYNMNLLGAEYPKYHTDVEKNTIIKSGTMLVFPFLTNGQAGVISTGGNIENLFVIGNVKTYNFHIDRTKTITAPNEVVNETIGTENGEEIKCIGIKKTGAGRVRNVEVSNFYTGVINTNITNTYYNNIFARNCHIGISVTNDTKLVGVYGWDCHTLLQIRGALVSATQVRVDSCVNVINFIGSVSSANLVDVDGDFCTDSLIKIGDDSETFTRVAHCSFIGIHGRCCTLKSYDSANGTKPLASDLTSSTSDGYGVITVQKNARFQYNYVQITQAGGGNPFDTTSNYLTPSIIFTFKAGASEIYNNIFIVNDKDVEDSEAYIKGIVQAGTNFKHKIETALGTYLMNGTTVDKFLTQSEVMTLINN